MATSFIISPGSAAKKYALFHNGVCVLEMSYECNDNNCSLSGRSVDGKQFNQAVNRTEFENAFSQVETEVTSCLTHGRLEEVTEVVVRVAVAGTFFQHHKVVTDEYRAELKKKEKAAPYQVRDVLRELTFCEKAFPDATIYAASDSAFHSTIPAHIREYSLSPYTTKSLDLYKFGVHGLSISSVVGRVHSVLGIDPEKMVVCHLGDTISVTAVLKGESVDTSAGLAPSSGFSSGTQAGDVDVSACLQLMKSKNLRPAEMELFLNTQGGLQAMAGSADIQVLLKRSNQKDQSAIHALNVFSHKIQQAIAAAVAVLEGVDAIVFTGTHGVRSPELRSVILQKLAYMGVRMNDERNNIMMCRDGVVSERNSGIKVVVLRSDEMSEMNAVIKEMQRTLAKKSTTS